MKSSSTVVKLIAVTVAIVLAGPSLHAQVSTNRNLLVFNAYGTETTHAVDFDDKGNVLGFYSQGFSNSVGFIRDVHGNYKEFLDPLTGLRNVNPIGMNNRGLLIGNEYFDRAWVHDSNTAVTREIKYPGASSTQVRDINDDGVVVGSIYYRPNAEGPSKQAGFIWRNGEFRLVETLGVLNTALLSINGRGDVGGKSGSEKLGYSGFILNSEGVRTEITAQYNGRRLLPDTLGNNGDFATSCDVADLTSNVCLFRAATGEILQYQSPCYSIASPSSMKNGAISGSCLGAFGGGSGFVVRKSAAFPSVH